MCTVADYHHQGLNGLPGFTMINPKVNLSAPAGTPNLMGTAVIPNPTIVTVELVTILTPLLKNYAETKSCN
jgi:hypothetical protein